MADRTLLALIQRGDEGLAIGVRLRVALDVAEALAEDGAELTQRGPATRLRFDRVAIDEEGRTSLEGAGDASGAAQLVWEIAAGRAVKWSGALTEEDLPDDVPGPVMDVLGSALLEKGKAAGLVEKLEEASRGFVDTHDDVRSAVASWRDEHADEIAAEAAKPAHASKEAPKPAAAVVKEPAATPAPAQPAATAAPAAKDAPKPAEPIAKEPPKPATPAVQAAAKPAASIAKEAPKPPAAAAPAQEAPKPAGAVVQAPAKPASATPEPAKPAAAPTAAATPKPRPASTSTPEASAVAPVAKEAPKAPAAVVEAPKPTGATPLPKQPTAPAAVVDSPKPSPVALSPKPATEPAKPTAAAKPVKAAEAPTAQPALAAPSAEAVAPAPKRTPSKVDVAELPKGNARASETNEAPKPIDAPLPKPAVSPVAVPESWDDEEAPPMSARLDEALAEAKLPPHESVAPPKPIESERPVHAPAPPRMPSFPDDGAGLSRAARAQLQDAAAEVRANRHAENISEPPEAVSPEPPSLSPQLVAVSPKPAAVHGGVKSAALSAAGASSPKAPPPKLQRGAAPAAEAKPVRSFVDTVPPNAGLLAPIATSDDLARSEMERKGATGKTDARRAAGAGEGSPKAAPPLVRPGARAALKTDPHGTPSATALARPPAGVRVGSSPSMDIVTSAPRLSDPTLDPRSATPEPLAPEPQPNGDTARGDSREATNAIAPKAKPDAAGAEPKAEALTDAPSGAIPLPNLLQPASVPNQKVIVARNALPASQQPTLLNLRPHATAAAPAAAPPINQAAPAFDPQDLVPPQKSNTIAIVVVIAVAVLGVGLFALLASQMHGPAETTPTPTVTAPAVSPSDAASTARAPEPPALPAPATEAAAPARASAAPRSESTAATPQPGASTRRPQGPSPRAWGSKKTN